MSEAPYDSVDFAEKLERECTEIGRSQLTTCEVTLAYTAERVQVPLPIASALLATTQILLRRAYAAVNNGHGGRIGVSFRAVERSFELCIEHSHSMARASVIEDREGSSLLRRIVAHADGRFETQEVIGGRRWLVTIPAVGQLAVRAGVAIPHHGIKPRVVTPPLP